MEQESRKNTSTLYLLRLFLLGAESEDRQGGLTSRHVTLLLCSQTKGHIGRQALLIVSSPGQIVRPFPQQTLAHQP